MIAYIGAYIIHILLNNIFRKFTEMSLINYYREDKFALDNVY